MASRASDKKGFANSIVRDLDILQALRDPHLFGGLADFRDLSSWRPWETFLASVYGLPLSDGEQKRFRYHTGRSVYAPPPGGWKHVICVVGRQSGKTTIAGLIAAYEAVMSPPEPRRKPTFALLVAQDYRGVLRSLFAAAAAALDAAPVLAQSICERRTESLLLSSGVTIAAYPCRPAAVRGLRARCVVCDELAFFRTAEGIAQDVEMLRALRPTLATTNGRLIILSSPYGQFGVLWDLYQRHFGRDDSSTLVWKATAPEMNPTLSADYLARMEQEDPEGYRSEVLGEFRAGLSLLFEPEALTACVIPERRERLPERGHLYRAACDPSGGRGDAFALAIAHRARDLVVLDAVRAWPPPFNPSNVVAEAAAFVKRYGIDVVQGDQYGGEWPREAFRSHHIAYEVVKRDRSALYLELLPLVNAGKVELLDLPDLLREFRGLERRRGPSGRDRVDHVRGHHDDRANAVASVVVTAMADDSVDYRCLPRIFAELNGLTGSSLDDLISPRWIIGDDYPDGDSITEIRQ